MGPRAAPDHEDDMPQFMPPFSEYNGLIGECRTAAGAMGRFL
jgi:hypothetical protein